MTAHAELYGRMCAALRRMIARGQQEKAGTVLKRWFNWAESQDWEEEEEEVWQRDTSTCRSRTWTR